MMERILENQRKFLEDHHVKIQDIENVIQTIVVDKKEKENQPDTGKEQKNSFDGRSWKKSEWNSSLQKFTYFPPTLSYP